MRGKDLKPRKKRSEPRTKESIKVFNKVDYKFYQTDKIYVLIRKRRGE